MRLFLSLAAALGAVMAFAVISDTGKPVQAAPVTIEVQVTGAQEVPPVTGPGSGFARLVYDRDAKTLEFFLTVRGISENQVTAAHIHRGAAGVNGPIVHFLSDRAFTQAAGTINLSDADIADLEAGRFYINIHSVEHPGGFARGQIIVPAAAAPAPAPAPVVSPPATGDAGLSAGPGATAAWLALAVAGVTLLGGGLALARRRV